MSESRSANQPSSAAAHPLDPLLAPRSIAFVGASQRPNSPGNDTVREALAGSFGGALYPINPRYDEVEGLRCFASIDELPETVDHAVLCVASEKIEAALAQAIRHGARAATIFASCYLEGDSEPALSKRIAAMAREAGIPICGANCMGFVNKEIGLRVAAYPCHTDEKVGPISWIAQSGSVYGALAFNDPRLKFNLCVSSGGEFATRSNDYFEWALQRESTGVVGLFIESIRDPEGFEAALSEAARREIPVVVLKAGRTPAAAAMARTHTGALAGDDAAYRALFDRYGVSRVDTLDELAATLMLLSHPARPGAGGLASIHDSGGECELLIDLAADIGVPLARIGDETKRTLSRHLDPGLEPVNPLDAWGIGHNAVEIFENCLEALMADPDSAAAAVVSDLRDGHYHHRNLAQVARTAAESAAMPVAFVTNYSSVNHREIALELTESGVPVLDGTREALQAFRHMFDYRDFLARPKSEPPPPPPPAVTKRWRERLREPKPLDEVESLSLLADYGIPVARAVRAASEDEALRAAAEIGYPVVLKTAQPGIEHKSEVGGVVLDLADPEALAAAYRDLQRRLGPCVSVSRRIPEGVEIALGAMRDPQFGSYVMVAAGGVLIELLADSAVSLAPLDENAAERLLRSLKARRLLDGLRGKPAADVASLCRAIAHLSVLADDLGDALEQLDVNPLIASADGCVAVDALVIARREA
ncbi:MAG: acetate--CoA ligase family protein [Deltaproteobacteria bacterium]|jgi:acyl-CoA synthetase (NDP forming)|nr:acetate--CoA ligase family protein [Deltaproteobacteria bacterium]MBW2542796.1 acetate--CoA ligase family protein [Deltaproteobacteria bacterium]